MPEEGSGGKVYSEVLRLATTNMPGLLSQVQLTIKDSMHGVMSHIGSTE